MRIYFIFQQLFYKALICQHVHCVGAESRPRFKDVFGHQAEGNTTHPQWQSLSDCLLCIGSVCVTLLNTQAFVKMNRIFII